MCLSYYSLNCTYVYKYYSIYLCVVFHSKICQNKEREGEIFSLRMKRKAKLISYNNSMHPPLGQLHVFKDRKQ